MRNYRSEMVEKFGLSARARGEFVARGEGKFSAREGSTYARGICCFFFLLSYRAAVSFMVFARTRGWKLYMKFPCAWD